ncbi:outer membrane beta-barrel protein [Luteibacter aegosomatissinici]|uniref:outer membrane beta-barrel protein n=1 Tax=Luteibacter aegosomatissinici TaxID=2911539 RepID=UPI001FF7513B|nr:outer membrane beta-barrel protein [Luteibacter aegosomatissinici]UPG94424.1 porin [Luteibacter aegosomatissinici]
MRTTRYACLAALLAIAPVSRVLAASSDDCSQGFGTRLAAAYREDAQPADPNAPAPARRAMPSSFPSPPFPSAEWQLGGVAYPIGVPNLNSQYPLEKAMACNALGKWMKDNRIEVYGWINPSMNISSSAHSNYPLSYATRPNRVEFNQALLRIERIPDTVQTDHLDWGFHLDNLYGYDYHYTTMKGVLSNQLLNNPRAGEALNGKTYGYDPMLFYGDIYIPWVAEGMVVRIGRYLSLPDIEAQFSPNNYLVTHSVLYTVDPYTQMGIMTTTRLSQQWTLQLGVNGGNDTAIWNHSSRPTLQACVRWVSADNNDMLYPCVNSFNSSDYNYNNVQMYVTTWGHRFSEKVHILTEGYYMYGRNIAGFGPGGEPGVVASSPLPGKAAEYGVVNYINVEINPTNMFSFRNEWYNDQKGQRTGFATRYTSHTLGMTHWVSPDLEIRPEVRYERSYDASAYDKGNKDYQLTALVDAIWHY